MDRHPHLRELTLAYEALDAEGRDELLQVILIAASVSWEQVAELLDDLAFQASVKTDLSEL